ncbi:hypothetical protein J2847_005799 [Azospirillum agricola]|uniref:hypothetical protein n=1 Tax=Azospirillum agricola TaxID=1720247 RepID=UPI001AE8964E|nr:hypothetical protein [Azospirillum agricola]MBP2232470.1 hypothetical protein [Azospirillum agricola]
MHKNTEPMGILKDRVKALTAPDREVDALIQIELNPEFGARYDRLTGPQAEFVLFSDVWRRNRADHINHANNVADWWKVPLYTASVDAAMTLMPVGVNLLEVTLAFNTLESPWYPAVSIRWYPPSKAGDDWHAQVSSAATIPLTICLAALELSIAASQEIQQ